MPTRKTIRLEAKNYIGQTAVFVTLCCWRRHLYFRDSELCNRLLEILRETAATRDFAIHAYCFMPDHLHILVEGLSPASDFLNLIEAFKNRSSRVFLKTNKSPLWQRYFFDHVLRESEDYESVCLYLWSNPIRAGLAKRLGEYPFTGSFTRNIPPKCSGQTSWQPPKPRTGPSPKMAPT